MMQTARKEKPPEGWSILNARYKVKKHDYDFGPHIHEWHEIILVDSGNLILNWDGGNLTLGAGFAVYIPADTAHSMRSGRHGELHFFGAHIPAPIPHAILPPAFAPIPGSSELRRISERFIDEAARKLPCRSEAMLNLSHLLLIELTRNAKRGTAAASRTISAIDACDRYIRSHISERLTPSTIADAIGISASHMRMLYRKKHGESPRRRIQRLRIEHACQVLRDDFQRINLAELARHLSFADYAHFSRTFQKFCGVGPREWQSGLRQLPTKQ